MINLIMHYANGEKLYEKVVTPVLKMYQVNYMEFTILMFLYNHPKFDTASQIIKYRHLAKSHVSTTIKSLINKGYLISHYEDNDHKSMHLKVTSLATSIIKEGLKKQEEFKLMLTSNLSKDEVEMFIFYLNKINDNINKNLK